MHRAANYPRRKGSKNAENRHFHKTGRPLYFIRQYIKGVILIQNEFKMKKLCFRPVEGFLRVGKVTHWYDNYK
jgi:hypothetical protein